VYGTYCWVSVGRGSREAMDSESDRGMKRLESGGSVDC
jgi:hypothetical protein